MILSYCKLGEEELYTETHPRNRYFQAALDSCRLFRENTVLPSPLPLCSRLEYLCRAHFSPTHEDKGTENIYYVGVFQCRAPPLLVYNNFG